MNSLRLIYLRFCSVGVVWRWMSVLLLSSLIPFAAISITAVTAVPIPAVAAPEAAAVVALAVAWAAFFAPSCAAFFAASFTAVWAACCVLLVCFAKSATLSGGSFWTSKLKLLFCSKKKKGHSKRTQKSIQNNSNRRLSETKEGRTHQLLTRRWTERVGAKVPGKLTGISLMSSSSILVESLG